jgi:hypothetical protein
VGAQLRKKVRGDPLQDPAAQRRPLLVMKQGKVVVDRR